MRSDYATHIVPTIRILFILFFSLLFLPFFFSASSTPLWPKNYKDTKNFRSDNYLCLISDFAKKSRGRRPISKKLEKQSQKVDWRFAGAVVRLLWRAAAPGLKQLRLPRARNEASSCPGIFSRTLRFYHVASSPSSPIPNLLDGHRKLVGCSAITARSCLGPARYHCESIL